jgi:hypothetical protein
MCMCCNNGHADITQRQCADAMLHTHTQPRRFRTGLVCHGRKFGRRHRLVGLVVHAGHAPSIVHIAHRAKKDGHRPHAVVLRAGNQRRQIDRRGNNGAVQHAAVQAPAVQHAGLSHRPQAE